MTELANIKPLLIVDLSAGLNSNPLSATLKDNESPNCQNIMWSDGGLQDTPGLVRHSGKVGTTGAITGICDYVKHNGTQKLVATTPTAAYYFNTTTNLWTDITGGLAFTDYNYQFIVFNDYLIGTNGNDASVIWDGGAGNFVTLASLCGLNTPPTTANLIATYNGRVFLANCVDGVDYPTRAYYSLLDNPLSWDTTDHYLEFDSDDGQGITAIKQLRNILVVYKNNSISIVSSGDNYTYSVERDYVKGVGCISGHSLRTGYVTIGGKQLEVHIFLSQEGLKAFDGTNVYSLPIPGDGEEYKCYEYFASQNVPAFNGAIGGYHRARNWALFFYPASDSSLNNHGCIYDYATNSLWPLSGVSIRSSAEVYDTTLETSILYVGSTDGVVYYLSETSKGVESTTELITDGGMETEALGAYGGVNYTTGAGTLTIVADAVTGTKSMQFATAALNDYLRQTITTVVGATYRAYIYIKSTVGAATSTQEFSATTSTGTALSESTTTLVAGSEWTRVEIQFTATTTSTILMLQNKTIALQTLRADDLTCRCIDTDSYFKTKYYDFGADDSVKLLREFVPFVSATGTGTLTFIRTFDRGAGSTSSDSISLTSGAITWTDDIDWALDLDWSSIEEVATALEDIIQDTFRSIQLEITNSSCTLNFKVNKLFLRVATIARRFY